jgi:hypothetical protein
MRSDKDPAWHADDVATMPARRHPSIDFKSTFHQITSTKASMRKAYDTFLGSDGLVESQEAVRVTAFNSKDEAVGAPRTFIASDGIMDQGFALNQDVRSLKVQAIEQFDGKGGNLASAFTLEAAEFQTWAPVASLGSVGDSLTGGMGADIFAVNDGTGLVLATDFNPGEGDRSELNMGSRDEVHVADAIAAGDNFIASGGALPKGYGDAAVFYDGMTVLVPTGIAISADHFLFG